MIDQINKTFGSAGRPASSRAWYRASALALLLSCSLPGVASRAAELPEAVRLTAGWELQDAAKVLQPGEALSQASFQPAGWYRATVPGTVLTSLVNDGVYPEPLYGENNRTIPESLARATYWYRTPFSPPAAYAGKRVWLTFHGINYIAEVWVNGHRVGTIKGAFARGVFDVTSLVVVGGVNALAVHVLPQPHPGETHEKTMATGTGLNGGITASDGPTFLCTIGWDWIPTIRDRDTGIWQEVTLSASGPVVVEDPYVTSQLPLPRTDSADLTVRTTLRNATDLPQTGTLTGVFEDGKFQQAVSLNPKETKEVVLTPATTPSLHLKHPRLWWPNGFGKPELYKLHLAFAQKEGTSDARHVSFGVRQISYSVPGSENLTLSVNGVPVMAKGGDWGMDEALKRITRQRLEAEMRMHQQANYTIIRNWVGQSTSEDFYDLLDQYGLLLWDEFFQPHPADGPVPTDAEFYLSNVREKILRFRSHACIALWCARNEGDPPPVIGNGIQKLINELDPTRLYQPSSTSGRGVNSGGPYHWRTPREFYVYREPFKTEIGSISVPTLEAIHAMMPAKDWDIINDDWAEHDFCGGAQEGDRYPDMLVGRYGPLSSLPDFVRKSQLANYEAFRAMYEGRFARLFKPETGVITWMSAPCQPSFVWQLYSHDLEPNSSLFAVRKACEPIHVMLNEENAHVMVINHTAKALQGVTLQAQVFSLDGTLQGKQDFTVNAPPSAATDASELVLPKATLSPVHFVKLVLRDKQQQVLSENFYWHAFPDRPDDFQALNALPQVPLDLRTKRQDKGGKLIIVATLANPSKSPALMAHLQLRKEKSGARVLPVFYSDNYVSLLPGEAKTLTIEASLAELGGETPLLVLDGWNVRVNEAAAHGPVRVALNTEALVPAGALPAAPTEVGINCGGNRIGFFRFGPGPNGFGMDRFFEGGSVTPTKEAVDASVANAAPAAVYQSERWGRCSYTIPVAKGGAYLVRLHFAEFKLGPGERKFNVAINGRPALTDYDIAAEVGKGKAAVKDLPGFTPDAQGNLVIEFTKGAANEPKVCGIQVLRQ